MKVFLINHTLAPESTVALAAKLCYSDSDIESLALHNLIEEKAEPFIKKLMDLGHQSPLEHCSFTFSIEGISRAASHQLVRHRIASYSQKSQRYVKEGQFEYITPPSITNEGRAVKSVFHEAMSYCQGIYDLLIERGIPAEDARFVLPNACETKIIVTMNARTLLHFFEERCCERAQWEIRAVAEEMLRICKDVAPNLFAKAGPSCVRGKCKEGPMSCGKRSDADENTDASIDVFSLLSCAAASYNRDKRAFASQLRAFVDSMTEQRGESDGEQ